MDYALLALQEATALQCRKMGRERNVVVITQAQVGYIMLCVFVGSVYVWLAILTTPLKALSVFCLIAFAIAWLTVAFYLMRGE